MPTLESFLHFQRGIDRLDLELLAAHVVKRDRSFVLAHPEYAIAPAQSRKLAALIKRRQQHEPLAYILGEKEFFGLPFFVNRHTLIPRPETELLVEQALHRIFDFPSSHFKKVAVVDVGTGSGCIIISLVRQINDQISETKFPAFISPHQVSNSTLRASGLKIRDVTFQFFAVDISEQALRIAKKNARRHGVDALIAFSRSNLLNNLKQRLTHFDAIIILANLPYLAPALYRKTALSVKNFEPKSALLSQEHGLAHYKKLQRHMRTLAQAHKVHFFLEISPEQTISIQRILGDTLSGILPDLAGKARVAYGQFR